MMIKEEEDQAEVEVPSPYRGMNSLRGSVASTAGLVEEHNRGK